MESKSLKELFHKWKDLNQQVEQSYGKFDFITIKELRKKQAEIEDTVYDIILKNVKAELKKVLPDTCGEMEVGFDMTNDVFYYLMYDPYDQESDKIFALTIDSDRKIEIIEDFKRNDEN